MKARTKSQKLAAKRGRPRLPDAAIEPNGRRSRRKHTTEKQGQSMDAMTTHTAVEARVRRLGLQDRKLSSGETETAEKQAMDPMQGYVLGRLFLAGKVTEAQHQVGLTYAEAMSRYYGLTGLSFPSARAQDLFAVRGEDGETSRAKAARAAEATASRNRARVALLAVGDINTGRRAWRVVNSICIEDDDRYAWDAALLARGLNALGKLYRAA